MQAISESLWASLLRESSKRSKVKEGTLIVVGNEDAGKINLVSAVSGVAIEKSSIALPSYVVMSSNDDLDDDKEKMQQNDGDFTRLHTWVLDKSTIGTFSKVILENVAIERVGVVITLDFSDYSNCISVLKEWLGIVQREIISALPLGLKHEQNKSNALYIDLCSRHRGMSDKLKLELALLAEDANNQDQVYNQSQKYCGIPLMIVGCKADVLDDNTYKASANDIKEVQAYIRYMCLELGASFVMTAASPAGPQFGTTVASETMTNISLLRKYLFHSMFPELISLSLSMNDLHKEMFVPAGLDSDDLINLSCIHRSSAYGYKSPTKTSSRTAVEGENQEKEKENMINNSALLYALTLKLVPGASTGSIGQFSAQALLGSSPQLSDDASDVDSERKDEAKLTTTAAEDEQEWLSGLYNQLLKYGASGSSMMDMEHAVSAPVPTRIKTPSPALGRTAIPGSPSVDGTSASTKSNSPGRVEPADGATTTAGIATVVPKPSRRASTRAAAAAAAGTGSGSQDPADFFKNLLSKK